MEVEVTALHLLAASIAGFLPFLLGVRPLYTILVAVRFHSNDVMYQWRFPKKLWDKQVRGKKTFVGIVLAFSVVGTVWALYTQKHISLIALGLSMSVVGLGLMVDLSIPPIIKITKTGIVIQTPDAISLIFNIPRTNYKYFVSWKRIAGLKSKGRVLKLVVLGHPTSSYHVFADPLKHTKILLLPLPREQAPNIIEFVHNKTVYLRTLLSASFKPENNKNESL